MTVPVNRSSEELAMRALIVPELRRRYPGARIIHELPLRYSTNRIDLAAVTETEIVAVEIKSSRDTTERLDAQLRAFLPISGRVIAALAPKWIEKLPVKIRMSRRKRLGVVAVHEPQYTPTQQILQGVRATGHGMLETWTVCAATGSIKNPHASLLRSQRVEHAPWPYKMLHILHVAELRRVAEIHGCWSGGSRCPPHLDLVKLCHRLMRGGEIEAAVCAALRARDEAFSKASDPPVAWPSAFRRSPPAMAPRLL